MKFEESFNGYWNPFFFFFFMKIESKKKGYRNLSSLSSQFSSSVNMISLGQSNTPV